MMIKKYSKILMTILCAFFFAVTSSSALEFTLDELTEQVKKINADATYVYVIGEYVFTSGHELTTEDIMYAARSIKIDETKDAKKQMAITLLEGIFDEDTLDLVGLEYIKEVVGEAGEKSTYDISYIDYEGATVEVEVNGLVDAAFNTIKNQASKDKFTVAKDKNTITVSIVDTEMDSAESLAGTGIQTAALNLLETEGVESVTLKADGIESVTVNAKDILSKIEDLEAFLLELAGEGKAGALDQKSLTVEIKLAEGYTTEDEKEFTIEFEVKEVEVNGLVDAAFNTIKNQASKDKFTVAKDKNTITVSIVDTEMDSAESLAGTGIQTAALNLLETEGVESVTLKADGIESVTVNAKDILSKIEDLEAFLLELAGEGKAGALDQKSLTVEIKLAEGYTTENEKEFTIEFEAIVSANF